MLSFLLYSSIFIYTINAQLPSYDILKDCLIWYDGCNSCKVINGRQLDCNNMVCAAKSAATCRKKKELPPVSVDCSASLTRKGTGFTTIKEKSWTGSFAEFFQNAESTNCPMNQCGLTDCSDQHNFYTGNKVTIDSKNAITVKYTQNIAISEILCVTCSNSQNIL